MHSKTAISCREPNTNPSTLGVNDQGPNDGPSLVKIGCLPSVRWYVSYCTYDVCSNLGYHNLPTLCEVRHFSIKSGKRRPIRIVAAVLLKRSDREAIDFLSVSPIYFSIKTKPPIKYSRTPKTTASLFLTSASRNSLSTVDDIVRALVASRAPLIHDERNRLSDDLAQGLWQLLRRNLRTLATAVVGRIRPCHARASGSKAPKADAGRRGARRCTGQ